jgi:hypothetical protein
MAEIWGSTPPTRPLKIGENRMNKNNLLTNRKYLIDQDRRVTWYSALYFLENYKSVACAEWTNTMSSAGDWDGYIVQHIGNYNFLIPIFQENNYPRLGFTLYTGDLIASWKGEYNSKEALNIYCECMEYGINQ